MRRALLFAGVVLAAAASFAGTAVESTDVADRPFSADFAAGGRLRLKVRSGDIRVVGTDENRISVEISGRNARRNPVKVRLATRGSEATLTVSARGPHNDVETTIRIPRKTDLYARVPFGDVSIEDVEGNKDVSIHAGDLAIDVGNAADYSDVRASVATGDLDGRPFGESKEGLFRSFHKEGTGKYVLRAHVGAGDLTLR